MKTIQDSRASVEQAQLEAREAQAFLAFYIELPEYHCDANAALLREYHHGEEITAQSLRESVERLKDSLAVKNNERLEQQQQDERTAALAQLYDSIFARGGDPSVNQAEFEKSKYWPVADIVAKAQQITDRTAMSKLPVAEVRAIVTAAKDYWQADQNRYPILPKEYTRAVIVKSPPAEIRRLLRVYSSIQINDRIANS